MPINTCPALGKAKVTPLLLALWIGYFVMYSVGDSPHVKLIAFLESVQETALATFGNRLFDPKRYVDLPLKYDLSVVEQAFHRLPRDDHGRSRAQDFQVFLDAYFLKEGSDLVYYEPPDYVDEPEGFLPKVKNPEVRLWALEIHSLWKNLSRKVSDRVLQKPFLHTLLPLPEAVIVPGSRFREIYYWDSYWIIRGLLASKMYKTAKGIVKNLIHLANIYGFVPNGARAYYTNRSQPPLLSAMVREIYNITGDKELASITLPALIREHHFWNCGEHRVIVEDCNGVPHSLNRYYAFWDSPRPESATTDKQSASCFLNDSEKRMFYREIASAAESGMDFSTRWMMNSSEFTTMSATMVVPVDLNIFILKMEQDISFFAKIIGEREIASRFSEYSQARKKAIESILWDEKSGQWFDYWLDGSRFRSQDNLKRKSLASNFVPLWNDAFNSDSALVGKVVKSLASSGLIQAAGIATSTVDSGEQWDYPNGWAPLQHLIVQGLRKSKSKEAQTLCEQIAFRWIRTNYAAYVSTGAMHEKYDVSKCGAIGGGGEYQPQIGFGWSNGVALAFLDEFGWPEDRRLASY